MFCERRDSICIADLRMSKVKSIASAVRARVYVSYTFAITKSFLGVS